MTFRLPNSARIGNRTDLRFNSDNIVLGENIVIDDDVRIVVPADGQLKIGDNVKIGKGTIINCGGSVEIGSNVAFYGYCYIQSSRWVWNEGQKDYSYFDLKIGEFSTIAPNTVISGNVSVPHGYRGQPGDVLGEW